MLRHAAYLEDTAAMSDILEDVLDHHFGWLDAYCKHVQKFAELWLVALGHAGDPGAADLMWQVLEGEKAKLQALGD